VTGIEDKILDLLNASGVNHELLEHKPVYTCRQMAKFLKTDQDLIVKSMILKTSEGRYLLAVLSGNMTIDYDRLARMVDTKSLSLAPVDEAEKVAECSVGCVHPFGNLIGVETYFDRKLTSHEYAFFNPGSHTKSVKINTRALVELVKPTIGEFVQPNSCTATAEPPKTH
jgi:prolyl-tRNA editing enzyme YbaK/EbsC (Cys-tRNA(Pro) deacylase)